MYHYDQEGKFKFKNSYFTEINMIPNFPNQDFFRKENCLENSSKLEQRNGYRYGILSESYFLDYANNLGIFFVMKKDIVFFFYIYNKINSKSRFNYQIILGPKLKKQEFTDESKPFTDVEIVSLSKYPKYKHQMVMIIAFDNKLFFSS